ncbi:MAG: hypothetical protein EXR76_14045 [Myxococcales bacterium]|nr:hypothetical protein [Myxococcales bacterium]
MTVRKQSRILMPSLAGLSLLSILACEADDPKAPAQGTGGQSGDIGVVLDGAGGGPGDRGVVLDGAGGQPVDSGGVLDGAGDQPPPGGADMGPLPDLPVPPMCVAAATDFPSEAWGLCPAQDGTLHAFEPENISTIARIDAWTSIAELLWEAPAAPRPEAFGQARVIYAQMEGLDSRVSRRDDRHLTATVPEGTNCRDAGVPELYPEYCVGPGRILPILTAAFDAGQAGVLPTVNAARIEAALLWFLYVSVYKEAVTCTTTKRDCDSAFAYYTGDGERGAPEGLARSINAASTEGHSRTFDAVLAVHCWRELDAPDVAVDLPRRDLALAQLDVALDFGVSRILTSRVERWAAANGAAKEADWAFLQVLGQGFLRAIALQDADVAIAVAAVLGGDGTGVLAEGLTGPLTQLFPCP